MMSSVLGPRAAPGNAQFHLAQAAGLSIAQEQVHLRLEGGEVGEDLLFEVGRFSVLPHSG